MDQERRNALSIIGLSMGVLMMQSCALKKQKLQKFSWEGYALGADSSVQLYGTDRQEFDTVIAEAVKLIARLENIFSLYDETSEIVRLNNTGRLDNASPEMIDLLQISKKMSIETGGAFDITVQPLWQFYDRFFFKKQGGDFDGEIAKIIPLIGSEKILIDGTQVSFEKEGMGISSNGIAQGYITDKVTEFLMARGFEHVLVDIGEYRAGGPQANGDPWRIGLMDPFDQISMADVVELSQGGLATSGGYGGVFDEEGQNHHLFNPATGLSTKLYASVTVMAKDATTADALSTAFSSMALADIKNYVGSESNLEVRITMKSGVVKKIVS
ncbi:MAG: FAD:protein FMN transferase [Emcibacteraceae bacterium]|nr:FAD:protein FMN transferase [Emcibacteraceae bacterium]